MSTTMYKKICEHCGCEYETERKKQRFHNFRCSRDFAFKNRTGFYGNWQDPNSQSNKIESGKEVK